MPDACPRPTLLQLAVNRFGDEISPAEERLFKATEKGEQADCREGPEAKGVIRSNRLTWLCNYGREYHEGHRISTARVESTVDQLVDWRMEKKQHMRWTRRGAQRLLHARCALLNGELGKYTRWSPSESSQVLASAA
jgi:hypothetical protein